MGRKMRTFYVVLIFLLLLTFQNCTDYRFRALNVESSSNSSRIDEEENLPRPTTGKTFFIAPHGDNNNNGLSTSSPFKTFSFALSKVVCADSINLMDGVYGDGVGTEKIKIENRVCSSGKILTIKALNQRKARILDNGTGVGLYISNSAYITVDGLVLTSQDNNYDPDGYEAYGAPARAYDSHHLTFKNLLAAQPNRYGNNGLITVVRITNSLFEDNEFYDFHRHGITASGCANVTIRRSYCATATGGLIGGYPNEGANYVNPNAGGACVALYPCTNCIAENIIADGSRGKKIHLAELNASGQVPMKGSKIFGSIGYKTGNNAIYINSRGQTLTKMPQDISLENIVIFQHSGGAAIRNSDAKSTIIKNVTTHSSSGPGIVTDHRDYGDGSFSTTALNLLSIFNGTYGIYIESGIQTWSVNKINSFGNNINFSPGLPANFENVSSVDPNLGNCIAWIPTSSPMKNAGISGDIGANVLYRYKNGVLTNERLWNPNSGEFPHGALVPGLNDLPGKSLFDVHKRLNINMNGCEFPAGY